MDAIDCLNSLQDNSVELILTDPPYFISRNSGYINNAPDKKEYIKKYGKHTIDFGSWDNPTKEQIRLDIVLKEFYRVLKPQGTLILFYDFWKMQELKECAEKIHFKQTRLGIWNKTNPVPINSRLNYLTNSKEFFITFVKKSKPTFNSSYDTGNYYYPDNGNENDNNNNNNGSSDIYGSKVYMSNLGLGLDKNIENCDTYYLPIVHGKERTKHQTQKPIKLIEDLVLKHSNEGDFVLDCFAGSGTTGVACQKHNRNCLLVEKEPSYIEIIKNRLSTLN